MYFSTLWQRRRGADARGTCLLFLSWLQALLHISMASAAERGRSSCCSRFAAQRLLSLLPLWLYPVGGAAQRLVQPGSLVALEDLQRLVPMECSTEAEAGMVCTCCSLETCAHRHVLPALCELRRCCRAPAEPDPQCCLAAYVGLGRQGHGLHDSSTLVSVDESGNVIVSQQYPPPPPPSPPAPPSMPPAPSTQLTIHTTACGVPHPYVSAPDTSKSTAKSGSLPLYFKVLGDPPSNSMTWPTVFALPLAPPTLADGVSVLINVGDDDRLYVNGNLAFNPVTTSRAPTRGRASATAQATGSARRGR